MELSTTYDFVIFIVGCKKCRIISIVVEAFQNLDQVNDGELQDFLLKVQKNVNNKRSVVFKGICQEEGVLLLYVRQILQQTLYCLFFLPAGDECLQLLVDALEQLMDILSTS